MPQNDDKQFESRKVSAEEFITSSPLFLKVDVDGFSPPQRISVDCFGPCAKETTWVRIHDPLVLSAYENGVRKTPDSSIKSVAYKCFLCNVATLTVVYREMRSGKKEVPVKAGIGGVPVEPSLVNITTQIMKIGHNPAPTVAIPKGLEDALGSDAAALYRKALISRNNGYGLAAVAYMRRVVEDKTNELIEVAAQYAESSGIEPEPLQLSEKQSAQRNTLRTKTS